MAIGKEKSGNQEWPSIEDDRQPGNQVPTLRHMHANQEDV
jgi:hypothetical protein